MAIKEFLEEREMYNPDIEDVVLEYTKLKCQELLEIVAEKAKTKNTPDKITLYGDFTGYYIKTIDKDSILNAVDLEKFCS